MNFDVKSISKICMVSEKQVRRWIRSGALKCEVDIDKRGKGRKYIISEQSLVDFCYEHSKYYYVLEKHNLVSQIKIPERRFTPKEIDNMVIRFRKFLEEL